MAGTPAYPHRWYLKSAAIFFAVIAAVQAARLLDLPPRIGAGGFTVRTTVVMLALIPLFFAGWLWTVVRWERRLLRNLRTYDHRLCGRCAYPLPGRTGAVTCPECGAPCDMDDLRQGWLSFRPRLSGIFR